MLLYYITDRKGFGGTSLEQRTLLLRRIAEAARAGVDYIQLREKDLDGAELEVLAREALHVIRNESASVRLLINTRLDVALAVGANGVHLPAGSPPVRDVRAEGLTQTERELLIGVSAHCVDEVQRAGNDAASFVVLAPIFAKVATSAIAIGVEVLRKACAASHLPVLALGGVNVANARACLDAGAAGIAGTRLFQENAVSQTAEALRWLEQHVSRSAG